MTHLSDDQLYAAVLDQTLLDPDAAAHLATCAECRRQIVALHQLQADLAFAQRSQPSPAALGRYAALFDRVTQQPSDWSGWLQRLVGHLTWDSRQQPALQGVRTAARSDYRLLYAAGVLELELLISGQEPRFTVEGELLAPQAALLPALVQLQGMTTPDALYEQTTADTGRFRLDGVTGGRYRLWIALADGTVVEFADLDLA
jgi:hypothetical protein